ncbi:hypothetical protein C8R45DRAFT_411081 [Mycena sanguinolenta]|nr:hypothetical protein C8R45DRAFT_411081 [Mycena sanguinolenta]
MYRCRCWRVRTGGASRTGILFFCAGVPPMSAGCGTTARSSISLSVSSQSIFPLELISSPLRPRHRASPRPLHPRPQPRTKSNELELGGTMSLRVFQVGLGVARARGIIAALLTLPPQVVHDRSPRPLHVVPGGERSAGRCALSLSARQSLQRTARVAPANSPFPSSRKRSARYVFPRCTTF